MNCRCLPAAATWFCLVASLYAEEHRVEVLEEGPPQDELSEALREQLAPTGLRIVRGSNRTVCELWFCRQWKGIADFEPTLERLYPFQPGTLIGVLRFRRRGEDFRSQQISRGVYTLRYGLQPVDGNHIGTSPTRDFLLMVRAEEDSADQNWTDEALAQASAEAAETSHPAMLCLQAARSERSEPVMRHQEEKDWWILQLIGQVAADGKEWPLPVDLVVAGHGEE